MKTQLLPEGNISSVALSRNCWIICFGIWRSGWWSFSLLKIAWRPFLFHAFIENPFKALPSGNVASTYLCCQWLMSWSPHDSLRAFTCGSQPYLSLTSAIICGDFNVPFDDFPDTCTISHLDPSSPWTFPSVSVIFYHYHWPDHVIF